MVIHSVSFTVGAAVFLVGFGLALWLRARRRGDRATGPAVLIAFPGLFLSLLAALDGPGWLYIPAWVLVVSAYLVQWVLRSRH